MLCDATDLVNIFMGHDIFCGVQKHVVSMALSNVLVFFKFHSCHMFPHFWAIVLLLVLFKTEPLRGHDDGKNKMGGKLYFNAFAFLGGKFLERMDIL